MKKLFLALLFPLAAWPASLTISQNEWLFEAFSYTQDAPFSHSESAATDWRIDPGDGSGSGELVLQFTRREGLSSMYSAWTNARFALTVNGQDSITDCSHRQCFHDGSSTWEFTDVFTIAFTFGQPVDIVVGFAGQLRGFGDGLARSHGRLTDISWRQVPDCEPVPEPRLWWIAGLILIVICFKSRG